MGVLGARARAEIAWERSAFPAPVVAPVHDRVEVQVEDGLPAAARPAPDICLSKAARNFCWFGSSQCFRRRSRCLRAFCPRPDRGTLSRGCLIYAVTTGRSLILRHCSTAIILGKRS